MFKKFLISFSVLTLISPQVEARPQYKLNGTVIGYSSEYGWNDGFHGRRTASGEVLNQWGHTAASRSLPFGTIVRVTLIDSRRRYRNNYGKSVILRINDRGPFVKNRILDISTAAARKIGLDGEGLVKVEILQRD